MLYDNTKATPKQQEAPSGASSGALNPKRVKLRDREAADYGLNMAGVKGLFKTQSV